MATTTLIEKLHAIEEHPWRDDYRHGKPLRAQGLAYLLRRYKLRSKQVWVDGKNVHGYESASFADAFARYLAPIPVEGHLSARPLGMSVESEHKPSVLADKTLLGGRAHETDIGVSGTDGTGPLVAPVNGAPLSSLELWDADPHGYGAVDEMAAAAREQSR